MSERKTYVEFGFPGSIVDEVSVVEVPSRNIEGLQIPDGAFRFRFFDKVTSNEDGVILGSERLNFSPMHFIGGRVMTLEEIRTEMPEKKSLIDNMESSPYQRAIFLQKEIVRPFKDGDIVLEVK